MTYTLLLAGLTLAFPFWMRAGDLTAATLAPANGASHEDNSGADWEIAGDLTLSLRAERAGGGSGRVYTITVVMITSGIAAPQMLMSWWRTTNRNRDRIHS